MTTITSMQNRRIKEAVRLRHGRHRERQGRILIDGAREMARAIRGGADLLEVFVCEKLCTGDDGRQLLAMLPDTNADVFHIDKPIFEKLAFGHRAEGVLGVAETPSCSLNDLTLPENPLVAVLEGVEKPGNVGAVVRSADAAGISAVIVADGQTDLFNPNAIRASLGAVFTTPVAADASGHVLAWLRGRRLAVVAARVDGTQPYTDVDYTRPTAIVLGSEAAGLSPAWSAEDIATIHLPMFGKADSLNVSATAAVLFYEARRQRTAADD